MAILGVRVLTGHVKRLISEDEHHADDTVLTVAHGVADGVQNGGKVGSIAYLYVPPRDRELRG